MANTRMHERLIVWQKAYSLCLQTYQVTKKLPETERYGLFSQMRRSSSSIPINIAEGNGRKTAKDRTHFFIIARASLEELHCEYQLCRDLEYINYKDFIAMNTLIHTTGYLLSQFIKKQ